MTLEKDENGITVPTGLLEQQSLTLTNKRLIIYKLLGLFKKKRELYYIIPIDEVEETYASLVSGGGSFEIRIRLKNNKEHKFELMIKEKLERIVLSWRYADIQRATTDRWVQAINNQIKR